MSVTTYGTAELMEVQRRIPLPMGFWMQFFPRVFTSTSEKIMFDELGEEEMRLAPFVAPLAQGKIMREAGYTTKSFRPAYLKPKGIVHPEKTLMRRAGEGIGGTLSPAARRDAVRAELLANQRSMIERRIDWMCAQAIMFGTVTVAGDDYPTQVVDFGRDSSLTVTLTSTARWIIGAAAGSAANPLQDIANARTAAFDLGSVPINTIVMGLEAYKGFTMNADVKDLLKRDIRNGVSDIRQAAFNSGEPWAFEGRLQGGGTGQGGYDIWTYRGQFRDEAGSRVNIMSPYDVVGIGDVSGVRAYGAILDLASLAAVEMFPKNWIENDPGLEYVMTQSAPLAVPLRPNASFRLRVGAAS